MGRGGVKAHACAVSSVGQLRGIPAAWALRLASAAVPCLFLGWKRLSVAYRSRSMAWTVHSLPPFVLNVMLSYNGVIRPL
jgi:hypothetical protein